MSILDTIVQKFEGYKKAFTGQDKREANLAANQQTLARLQNLATKLNASIEDESAKDRYKERLLQEASSL
jgi:HD superfamily phosphodiesterase